MALSIADWLRRVLLPAAHWKAGNEKARLVRVKNLGAWSDAQESLNDA
jgi:hypothetical protein